MINFLRSLLPQNTPPHILKRGELAVLRERIFQGLMLIAIAAVVIAFFILVTEEIINQNWIRALTFTFLSIVVIAYAAIRKVPFIIRAVILVVLLLASGVLTFVSAGTAGNAKIYLVTASVLASVFLGLAPGVVTLVVGLGITLSFTIGKTFDVVSDAVFFTIIGLLASVSTALLVTFLQNSLKKQSDLTQELEYERVNLKLLVDQSVGSLEQRLTQIRTAVEITRSISSTLDPQTLLQQVVDLIGERFGLYYVGLFLLDDSKKYAVLRAGTGKPGREMIAENYRLAITESSMIGWSIIHQQARIAQDVGQDTVRFKNPFLPLTNSEMALPFISRGTALGAVSIQSEKQNAFDENDILILQGIVDSLSVAFDNARLFEQSRKDLEEIRALNREYLQKSWAEVGEIYGDIEFAYQSPLSSQSSSSGIEGSITGTGEPQIRTVNLPITLRDEVIGEISIESDTPQFEQSQLEFIEAIALQTALALDNARLIEKTQRNAIQEQTLSQISAQLSQALSVEAILKTAVKEIGQLPAINEVSIHLVPPSTDFPGSELGQPLGPDTRMPNPPSPEL